MYGNTSANCSLSAVKDRTSTWDVWKLPKPINKATSPTDRTSTWDVWKWEKEGIMLKEDSIEPQHEMYGNTFCPVAPADRPAYRTSTWDVWKSFLSIIPFTAVSIEPQHEMYGNSLITKTLSPICIIEPQHEMYGNWFTLFLPFKAI